MIMAIILSFIVPISVSAKEPIGDVVEPLVYTPCTGGNGICQMVSKGFAFVYDKYTGEQLYSFIACWQCRNCMTAMATEGEPPLNQSIGHYVVVAHYESLNANYNNLFVDPSRIGYTTSTRLEGYRFMYDS